MAADETPAPEVAPPRPTGGTSGLSSKQKAELKQAQFGEFAGIHAWVTKAKECLELTCSRTRFSPCYAVICRRAPLHLAVRPECDAKHQAAVPTTHRRAILSATSGSLARESDILSRRLSAVCPAPGATSTAGSTYGPNIGRARTSCWAPTCVPYRSQCRKVGRSARRSYRWTGDETPSRSSRERVTDCQSPFCRVAAADSAQPITIATSGGIVVFVECSERFEHFDGRGRIAWRPVDEDGPGIYTD